VKSTACAARQRWSGRCRRTFRVAAAGALYASLVAPPMHAFAQDASMLDSRVTQHSVNQTICRPGYVDTVSPPLDRMMAHREALLQRSGIDPDDSDEYALDRRVPILLGGAPEAPANLDLLPWAGHDGERRKALLAVKLKRCVCAGKISLRAAQSMISGNWAARYLDVAHMSCDADGDDMSTDDGS
jgi:hypothetical protein